MSDQFRDIKIQAYEANMEIPAQNLAIYTFGNVSAFDREKKVFAIKPSGVPYSELRVEDMVIMDLEGNKIEGTLNPSSDTETHRVLYKAYPALGGICHTHSKFAVAWAQAKKEIPIYGTTHADHLAQNVPVTEVMQDAAIEGNYEEQTGYQILDAFKGINPEEVPMILVACHGPFTWGKNAEKAVYHAKVLEEIAEMAYYTRMLNPGCPEIKDTLKNKHYLRKHGKNAYYGQGK